MASVVQDPRQAIGPEKEAPRAPAAAPQGFNPGGFPPKQAGEKDRHCLLRPCAIGRDSCKTTNLSGYNVSRFVDVLPVKQSGMVLLQNTRPVWPGKCSLYVGP